MNSNDIAYLKSNYPDYVLQAEKNYWHNFFLLVLDSATFTFATAMFSKDTILPYFITLLTTSPILIGLVPAVYFFGYYAPQLLGAYMANHRSRRKPMILGIVIAERLGILMIALTAQFFGRVAPQWILFLFFISFMVFSFLNGLIGPAYSDFVGKNIVRSRGFFYGVSYALSGAMGLIASLISRYFLDQFPSPVNFQIVFWLGFGFSFLSPFFVARLREVELPFISQTEPLQTFFQQIPGQLKNSPLFLRFIWARALVGLGLMGTSFYAIYAIHRFSLSEGNLGSFTMIILLAQSVLSLVWGWVGDRFGYKVV